MSKQTLTEEQRAQMDAAAEALTDNSMMKATNGRSMDEAVSELEREYQVRERCFPKWVQEGRLSRVDAKDRLERQAAAIELLKAAAFHNI